MDFWVLKRKERRDRRRERSYPRFWKEERERGGFESLNLGFEGVFESLDPYPFEKKVRGSLLYTIRGGLLVFGDVRPQRMNSGDVAWILARLGTSRER